MNIRFKVPMMRFNAKSWGSAKPRVKKNSAFNTNSTLAPMARNLGVRRASPKTTSMVPKASPNATRCGNTQARMNGAKGVVGKALVTRGTNHTAGLVSHL